MEKLLDINTSLPKNKILVTLMLGKLLLDGKGDIFRTTTLKMAVMPAVPSQRILARRDNLLKISYGFEKTGIQSIGSLKILFLLKQQEVHIERISL